MLNKITSESQENLENNRATSSPTSGVAQHQSTQAGATATATASGRKRKSRVRNPGRFKQEQFQAYLESEGENQSFNFTTEYTTPEATANTTVENNKDDSTVFAAKTKDNPEGLGFRKKKSRIKNPANRKQFANEIKQLDRKKSKGSRPGFSDEFLNQHSRYSTDLPGEGFKLPEGLAGRVFDSSTSEAKIVRLDRRQWDGNEGKYYKYRQSEGKGRFFKHFQCLDKKDAVVIAEGIFDALAIHSLGFDSIAYSGIHGAFDGNEFHSDFTQLLNGYDKVVIGFDVDSYAPTQLLVEAAVEKLDKLLTKLDKEVEVVTVWDKALGKDFADILANHGAEKLIEVISTTVKFEDWVSISAIYNYTPTDGAVEDTRYITHQLLVKKVEDYTTVHVKSPMNSGKTYSLAKIFKAFPEYGGLIISPLIVLGKQIAGDLKESGIDFKYRDELSATDNWERLICCLESITPNNKLNIKKDGSSTIGKIAVIDEAVEVVERLLESNTIAKVRTDVVELLTALLRNAEKCIFMSADLTDYHCAILDKLTGHHPENICKYQNTRKCNQFKGYNLGSPEKVIQFTLNLIAEGSRVFLGVDSQKTTSTYATGNLAELFKRGGELFKLKDLPPDKVLVLDSETTKQKGHPAHEIVVKGKYHLLDNYWLVIASPSVQSGLSLKPEIYSPDAVVLLHMGCASPKGVCQLSMRVRNLEIPRYFGFGGYVEGNLRAGKAKSKGAVKRYYGEKTQAIAKATNAKNKNSLLKEGLQEYLDLTINVNVEDLYLEDDFFKLQAIMNLQIINRETVIFSELRQQGAIIERKEITVNCAIKDRLKEIKEKRIQEEAEREANAPDIDERTLNNYKEREALTLEEHDSQSKFYAQKVDFKYDDVTTEDLIDRKIGKLEPEKLLFWLQDGRPYLEFTEQERILRLQGVPQYNVTKLLEGDKGTKVYKHDIVTGSFIQKILLLEEVGINGALAWAIKYGIADLFLEGTDKQVHTPELILELCETVKARKKDFINLFGWGYKTNFDNPIILFKNLLKEIGYKYSDKVKVRTKDIETKKIRQIRVSEEILPTRAPAARKKRFEALIKPIQEKFERFKTTQLHFNIGRQLKSNDTDLNQLVKEFGLEPALEAARRLPRQEYGLSKHSQILMQENKFQFQTGIPITIANPNNLEGINSTIKQWVNNKTEIGFDTETYEGEEHRKYCSFEKGKWTWLNPQTGKKQTVKPGLDQNNNQVRLLQFCDGKQTIVFDLRRQETVKIPEYLNETWELLKQLCNRNTLVGHNIKFDTSSVRQYGLIVRHPVCTLEGNKILLGDFGAGKVQSEGYTLKSSCHNLLNIEIDKTEQQSNWGAEHLSEAQIKYAASDAVYALILKRRLEAAFQNPIKWGLAEFANADGEHSNYKVWKLENDTIYHATEMQWRGVPCDVGAVEKTIRELEMLRSRVEQNWYEMQMPCKPSQAPSIVKELNKRYVDKIHPLDPEELAYSLGINIIDDSYELPEVESFTGTSKDVINEHPEIPELLILKAWRSYNTAITQLSKVLVSCKVNNGVCRTTYKTLSGTGRMACGNDVALGSPNLQAFVKEAEGKFFGYTKESGNNAIRFWGLPSVKEVVKIRKLFKLNNETQAFFTEDADSSHARLAVGFGKCEFGKKVLENKDLDNHSMFCMLALQAILEENSSALDAFPSIRDHVKNLSEEEIRSAEVAKKFKNLDKEVTGKKLRDAAKRLYYSVLNGAQADKMRKVLSGAIAQPVSAKAGEVMFDKFWSLYQGIKNYIDKVIAEAEANEINFGGIAFNLTTIPDGSKLLYARKNGDLATTNIIACQWSRAEATALKKTMAAIENMPEEYEAKLVNMVHDEVGVICNRKYWKEAYSFTSDTLATEYDVYLEGFIPSGSPTKDKLKEMVCENHNFVPTNWGEK